MLVITVYGLKTTCRNPNQLKSSDLRALTLESVLILRHTYPRCLPCHHILYSARFPDQRRKALRGAPVVTASVDAARSAALWWR
ncbi:hypothetical protein FB472_1553 [Rhodoglobus vestalii]|uniref:Uncharacterized protein n=1 Tax=Rhodoglobus vestalii TaxID=193384 RepID=A0A8H2K8D8_9MICO|nr:hypothetical protein FB472_1553 [Rhodoglobus vestalii]